MLWVTALSLLVLHLSPANAQTKISLEFEEVVYHTCYDGDTCMVSLPGVLPFFGDHILIRLDGIDTPEIKGKCERENLLAREARNFLRGVMEQATTIRLIKAHRDKYFRIDATIVADGVDTSELMINKGYAVPYDGGTKKNNWCGLEESMPSKENQPRELQNGLNPAFRTE